MLDQVSDSCFDDEDNDESMEEDDDDDLEDSMTANESSRITTQTHERSASQTPSKAVAKPIRTHQDYKKILRKRKRKRRSQLKNTVVPSSMTLRKRVKKENTPVKDAV